MSKLIQCKNCGKIYPSTLKCCPECFAAKPKQPAKIALGIAIVVLGVLLIISGIVSLSGNDLNNPSPTPDVSSTESNKNLVTYANFEKIENGMTYEQVVEIFGVDGKVLSEVDMGDVEYKTTMYYWYDDTGIANCNITFQGGVVIAKAQIGLQ